MSQFLLYYQRPEPTTWVYLSSFLTIGLYFVFHRFWSVRNLDILLLILLAPGVLMVNEGRKRQLAAASGGDAATATARDTLADSAAAPPATLATASASSPLTAAAGETVARETVGGAAAGEASGEGAPVAAGDGRLLPETIERRGFLWLFAIELLILIRLLLDPMMVRRPLLDPNLTTGGLAFIGVSMLIFLMANVVTSTPQMQREQGPQLGPGYPVLNMLPAIPTTPDSQPGGIASGVAGMSGVADGSGVDGEPPPPVAYAALARTLAILAHVAVVVGITMIGYRHFSNFKAGAGCATLYLMLPYTAQMTGRVDHVLPAALLVWAVLMYRRPLVAGICLGSAAGVVYYPLFLLPLWISFYRKRGLARFAGGFAITLLVLTVLLSLGGGEQLIDRLRQMFGLWVPWRWTEENLQGLWGLGWDPIWRLPVLVAFVLLSGLYAVWPGQKNLGTLMSCSAALMVAAQFWHGFGGGLYIAWFLPLMLLTIFRPNLEDRVALKVLGSSGSVRRPLTAGLGTDAA